MPCGDISNIHRVTKKVVHQAHIDNLVNSQLNFIFLPQLLCAKHKVAGSSHLSKTMA